jgi:hypothetical protein
MIYMKSIFKKSVLMRTMTRLLKTVFIFLIFLGSPTIAQYKECGTVITPEQIALESDRIAMIRPLLAPPVDTFPYHIPLTIHIVRRSDGTDGFTSGQLDTAMHDLNTAFESMDMRFFRYGQIDYINSDYFFDIPDDQNRRDELRQHNPVSNTINVYFTNLAGLCGQSSFTSSTFQGVLIDNSCAGVATNPSTFPHEIGHYFDLYHTHETAFGVECPDGSNCTGAGDLLCDTPADPNLSGRVSTACIYDNSAAPPAACDNTPYAPQVSNLMSYARATCRNIFTADQRTRALSVLNSDRSDLYSNTIYVDAEASGIENGRPDYPFNTATEAVSAASSGNYIFIKSGNYPSDILTISKILTLDKWNIDGSSVRIGQ